MDNNDCGSLGNETPPPIWEQIFVFQGINAGNTSLKHQMQTPLATTPMAAVAVLAMAPTRSLMLESQVTKEKKSAKSGGFGVANNAKCPECFNHGESKELCVGFSTRNNCGCPLGSNCNKFHLTESKWKELDSAKQAEVTAFIAKTKNLAFAKGLKRGNKEKPKGKPKTPKKAKTKHPTNANAKEPVEAVIGNDDETVEEEG
jgi:hypothetical protein